MNIPLWHQLCNVRTGKLTLVEFAVDFNSVRSDKAPLEPEAGVGTPLRNDHGHV